MMFINNGRRRALAAVGAAVALIGAGCGSGGAETETSGSGGGGGSGSAAANAGSGSGGSAATSKRAKAVRYSECMREHGVAGFPDPNAKGELTLDGVVNGSSLDPDSAAFKQATGACQDLQPPGFTGRKRSAQQQDYALLFAQCMRENGFPDFPDPEKNGPLIDTTRMPSEAGRGARDIPGFDDATHKCGDRYAGKLGIKAQ
jgi:hypothetical protein